MTGREPWFDSPRWPYRWPWSTTAVPAGTCIVHGSFSGGYCPTCSTAALTACNPVALPLAANSQGPSE